MMMLAVVVGPIPTLPVTAAAGLAFELHPLLSISAAIAILAVMTLLPWYLSRRRGSRLARWLHLDETPEE
ncbi:hypothetical protein M8009_15520 [Halomonas sp. ATCH28]|uniref:Uncharacterized protein n=1 Tax=Halomonas gemina TaxID=2945105 RepID=A0ABT0T454_9GAMM|nr:hypothetical protein [Halomonas gemina]MCL7941698.1 hypothetical protein [Halomonas gemina]